MSRARIVPSLIFELVIRLDAPAVAAASRIAVTTLATTVRDIRAS
jgi:hypothetical protein